MCSRLKPGTLLLLVVLVVITAGTADEEIDCDNGNDVYTLPCNPDLDPWRPKREKLDALKTKKPEYDLWTRAKSVRQQMEVIGDAHENIGESLKKMKKVTNLRSEEQRLADKIAEENAMHAAKKAERKAKRKAAVKAQASGVVVGEVMSSMVTKTKGAKATLKNAMKVLGAVAGAIQFLGPIMDIIFMFMPKTKSAELKAIESGFAEMGQKLDAVTYKLDNIEGASEWNAIVDKLLRFESTVDVLTRTYEKLVTEIKSIGSQDLPVTVKGHMEDLVAKIRGTGNIEVMLKEIEDLFKGDSLFIASGNPLLEMFRKAVKNDCSKILPMANKLMKLVRNAQRLQFFYEVNQRLCKPDDDKGYPKMLYDMYKETIIEYKTCAWHAVSYAKEEMEINHGNGDELTDIIDTIDAKYEFYNWATMKQMDKKNDYYALIDNSAKSLGVGLTKLSDEDKKDQQLDLFVVTKSSSAKVNDAIDRIEKMLPCGEDDPLKLDQSSDGWSESKSARDKILEEVQQKLSENAVKIDTSQTVLKDNVLKSYVDGQKITIVMSKKDSKINLDGWHYKCDLSVVLGEDTDPDHDDYTLGFLFNFEEDVSNFQCNRYNGQPISMSFEGSYPYCLCNFGYGGDSCDISLNSAPSSTISNTVLNLVQMYKVPGMFDLQEDIKRGTDKVIEELEENRHLIFTEAHQTRLQTVSTKNAILSAQSIMINDIKAANAKLFKKFSGLGEAMEYAFEKERNDRIYETEKGQKVIIGTIDAASDKVIQDLEQLTGEVVKNRFYTNLKFVIPVYQENFELATTGTYGNYKYAKDSFVKYLDANQHNFNIAMEAVKNAIVEPNDSFLVAQMKISMVSGCTDDYTKRINSTWNELLQLHSQMYNMKGWAYGYEIETSTEQGRVRMIERQINILKEKQATDLEDIKRVRSRSCPAFDMSDLLGGGCVADITYAGQSVHVKCSDSDKSLILASGGDAIATITCKSDSTWDIDVNDLTCVSKCVFNERYYEIRETRTLPAAPTGYNWMDKEGNVATQTTCVTLPSIGSSFPAMGGTIWNWLKDGKNLYGYFEFFAEGDVKLMHPFNSQLNSHRHGSWHISDEGKILEFRCCGGNYYRLSYEDGIATLKDPARSPPTTMTMKSFKKGVLELQSSWSKVTQTDINECATPGLCGFGGTCTNSIGSFTCTCPPGFSVGADGRCDDAKECSLGMEGYKKCLVQYQLGVCVETIGSYRCACFAGTYTNLLGNECIACNCNTYGVQSAVCDDKSATGVCRCRANVEGKKCDRCKTGYTHFPYCDQCAPGYYGREVCEAECDCDSSGTSPLVCNAAGKCDCSSNVGGERCDKCMPYYKDFPFCRPDIKNGILADWGPWGEWTGEHEYCGNLDKKGYYQRRTRERKCDNTKKNQHGTSCHDEIEVSEPRFHEVCKKVESVWIEVADETDAGTTGEIYMRLKQSHKQGTVWCETAEIIDSPAKGKKYYLYNTKCDKTFDRTRSVFIWFYNTSGHNAIRLSGMGLTLIDSITPNHVIVWDKTWDEGKTDWIEAWDSKSKWYEAKEQWSMSTPAPH